MGNRVRFVTTVILFSLYAYNVSWAESSQSPLAERKENQFIPDPNPIPPPTGRIPSGLIKLGQGRFFSQYALVLDKSTRTLSLWQNNHGEIKLVQAFAADYGQAEGDKFARNDLRTPEGIYFFQKELSGQNLNFDEYGVRAFTMDYPNYFDKTENKTGDGIWLHAIPASKTLLRGSKGCVVVRNESIERLRSYISLKTTPILVQNSVTYIEPPMYQNTNQKLLSWLEKWRQSWETKNLDQYMSHYSDHFKTPFMNKVGWKEYKKDLNERYKIIRVQIDNPIILQHEDEVIVRFIQSYHSDSHGDFGEKFLYLKNEGGQFKIVNETWKGISAEDSLALIKSSNQGS